MEAWRHRVGEVEDLGDGGGGPFGGAVFTGAFDAAGVACDAAVVDSGGADRADQAVGLRGAVFGSSGGEQGGTPGADDRRAELGEVDRAEERVDVVSPDAAVLLSGAGADLVFGDPLVAVIAEEGLAESRVEPFAAQHLALDEDEPLVGVAFTVESLRCGLAVPAVGEVAGLVTPGGQAADGTEPTSLCRATLLPRHHRPPRWCRGRCRWRGNGSTRPSASQVSRSVTAKRTCRPTRWNAIRRAATRRRTNRGEVFRYCAVSATVRYCSIDRPLLRGLIGSCRTLVRWCVAGGEEGGVVVGSPSLALVDGVQEQDGAGWDVAVTGVYGFPVEGPVIDRVGGFHSGLVEELPNERRPFRAVVGQGLVGPLAGDEDAASGDAEVFGLVRFARAMPGCRSGSGALGFDAVEQPDRAARRARRDREFGGQAAGVLALP
ncbi:hypothetical protein Ae505Ps2_6253 [Pseudonocardia sp. Ae505_Ps2]|nr:hypothetical protein Ae505Ps2_6253 [Pseudonocardia sp. Ae505_Ps2]